MKRIALLPIFFLASMYCFGQEQPAINLQDPKPFIEVTGTAKQEIVPDEIYIMINIQERQIGKNKQTIAMQEQALRDAFQAQGINTENLVLADAQADYIKVKWSRKDVVKNADYQLKVADAETVGKVFQVLDDLNIKSSSYIDRVSHSKIVELQREIRVKAIQAAKEKADYLLEAIGEKTGPALIVKEVSTESDRIYSSRYGNYKAAPTPTSNLVGKAAIQFKKIKLVSSVYTKFAIQ